MPWLQLKFTVDADLVEDLSQSLEHCGAQAVSLEEAGKQPHLFERAPEDHPLWSRTQVTGWFAADTLVPQLVLQVSARFARPLLSYEYAIIPDQDWEEAARAHFKPLCFGERLWICPSWHTPPAPAAVNVILDPGLAFGTGTHASTALCLEWLATAALDGQELIDFGCGSGILAIAALKLGAHRVWGVDIDAQALAVSRENALRNGVSKRYLSMPPELLPLHLKVDVVMANILAEPLMRLAPRLTALVRPRGHLLLAGLLLEQIQAVEAAYGAGIAFARHVRDGWALLVGTKIDG